MSSELILGIETSCDETGVALISGNKESGEVEILSEKLHSQVSLHKDYGGVVPELAAREHTKNLPVLIDQVFSESNTTPKDIDMIGVTVGPGLKGCLLTGMLYTSGLAFPESTPIIPINHIEAHVLSVLLDNPELKPPFLALVVSGGHTELHLVEEIGKYALVARTTDDAAGEAFDKSANLLGLPYPGGRALAELADSFRGSSRFTLPVVMKKAPGFSFSGLKTAISLLVGRKSEELKDNTELKQELAWTIQDSIIQALLLKTRRALKLTRSDKLAVSGGVSANNTLRKELSNLPGVQTCFPKKEHSVDNGVMIANCAFLKYAFLNSTSPLPSFEARPRWKIEHRKLESV